MSKPSSPIPPSIGEHIYADKRNLPRWKQTHSGRRKNKIAGWIDKDGYRYVRFNLTIYKWSRISFFLAYGETPKFIDHVDCNKLNDDPKNLRAATRAQNAWNRKTPSNNTSGIKGISVGHNQKGVVSVCAGIMKKGKRLRRYFSIDKYGYESALSQAVSWLDENREILHGDFARS